MEMEHLVTLQAVYLERLEEAQSSICTRLFKHPRAIQHGITGHLGGGRATTTGLPFERVCRIHEGAASCSM